AAPSAAATRRRRGDVRRRKASAVLTLSSKDRVRILAATLNRSRGAHLLRMATMTASLVILAAPPALGWFRIDLWRWNHLLLGAPATLIEALKGFVVAMAILYGVTFLTNMIVGRFFCGWGCPIGYVSRLGEDVDRVRGARRKLGRHLLGAGFVAAFLAALMTWWVDPRVLAEGSATARAVVLATFGALAIGGFLHAFRWRFGVCLHACPIGLYYRLVTSRPPVSIVFIEDPSACVRCGACETVCPVLLDPKRLGEDVAVDAGEDGPEARYGDAECVRCGDCVAACRLVFAKRAGETPPLRFGWTRRDGAADVDGRAAAR
ncbi:MAG TPA: 4Fe-4S dicluster domain-containing protein, partial [Planctomycetota bacterium]|nr:4Fe-4S dicluster domain-containing protein [Planctomycetota bacterium]